MSIVVHAPPPRCPRCGRSASADGDETACLVCGAPLPPRGAPLVVPISGDIALGETLPAFRTPEVPTVRGTALLSIERITQLRVTMDAATIDAKRAPGTLRLTLMPHAVADGLTLPANVGVHVGLTEDLDRLQAVHTKLVEEQPVSIDFPFEASATEVVVTLSFADALCRRRVEVR